MEDFQLLFRQITSGDMKYLLLLIIRKKKICIWKNFIFKKAIIFCNNSTFFQLSLFLSLSN